MNWHSAVSQREKFALIVGPGPSISLVLSKEAQRKPYVSVSKSNVPEVVDDIRNQEEHHRQFNYPEEFLALLRKHGSSTTSDMFGTESIMPPATRAWSFA
jgi:hypothetical protein